MKEISDNLQKADMFEKAIEILDQMKVLCLDVLFDYEKVSKILIQQSNIYKQLAEKPNRNYCIYFKLGFYGMGYPHYLRNRQFIFRGTSLARRSDVIAEMKKHFPEMVEMNHTNEPDSDIKLGYHQFLQFEKVQPLTYKEIEQFNLNIKGFSKEYYEKFK